MRNARTPVIHPVLFTAYAILALAAANIQELPLEQAGRSLVVGTIASVLLLLAARLLFRDWHKAGVMSLVLLLFFFAYGHVYTTLEQIAIAGVTLGRHRYLLPASALLMIMIGVWLARRRSPLDQVTRLLNALAILLLAFPLFTIGRYGLTLSREGGRDRLSLDPGSELVASVGIPMPDIYYIILDGYARSDVLGETFAYDNSDFVRFLEERGFFVAQDSHTNFFKTAFSLSSSLNMEYIQDLGVPLEPGNYPTPFVAPIRHSVVRMNLEDLGYTTVAIRSGYLATEWIDADYYLAPDAVDLGSLAERSSFNAFETLLVHTSAATILRDLGFTTGSQWGGGRVNYPFDLQRLIVFAAFDNLEAASRLPSPKLVFAHIVSPHSPFLFDEHGTPLDPTGPFTLAEDPVTSGLPEAMQKYRGQAIFVGARIQAVVERILEESGSPPVIIIQGDHGYGEDWQFMDSPGARQRAAILNAYRLPYGCDRLLYPSITPVNTFRLVFNCYFDASYPLLEDITYWSPPPWGEGYGFVPMNDLLEE
jgi:hypothetical protein